MFIIIELQDHEAKSHRSVQLEFELQPTIKEVKSRIQLTFHVPTESQEIYDKDNRRLDLLVGPLCDVGVVGGCVLVLKHALLENYRLFFEAFQFAQNALQSNGSVENCVDRAFQELKILVDQKFFSVYPTLGHYELRFKRDFSGYLDVEFKYISVAAHHYFSVLYGDNPACPAFDIICLPKRRSGAQGGLECHVRKNEILLQIYHVKVHTRLAKFHQNKSADLRELFAYKVLEIIQMGPKVHFFPNVHYSGFGLYIATEEVSGFRRECDIFDDPDADEEERRRRDEEERRRLAKLKLISYCLYLKDLQSNQDNFGVDDQGRLSIVDFEIRGHDDRAEAVVKKYLCGDKELRIDVGRTSFSNWNLLNSIDLADTAIDSQKQLLKNHSITFKSGHNYAEYLDNVKKVVVEMAKAFQ